MKSAYKFNSTAFLTVDEKSRLLVPVDVRRKLDPVADTQVFVITIGNNGKMWLWPERYYDERVYRDDSESDIDDIDPTPEQLERMISRNADIDRVLMDKQGRLLLPDTLRRLTNTGDDVALLGVVNHLQLWNRVDYAQRQEDKQRKKQNDQQGMDARGQ